MGRLEGKVAVLTGAASGIGRATALKMAQEGASVVVADINRQGAEAVVSEIRAAGGRAAAVLADVSDESAVKGMIAAAVDQFGKLNILFNNAADLSPQVMGLDADVVAIDPSIWDRTMTINLRGVMLGCKYGIPAMLEAGGGAIINTSSCNSFRGEKFRPAYAASKAGVNALTRHIATAYGRRGIRCNAVAPGLVLGDQRMQALPDDLRLANEKRHLIPRLLRPEDLANVVAFLASDEGAGITGQTILVDGGVLTPMVALHASIIPPPDAVKG